MSFILFSFTSLDIRQLINNRSFNDSIGLFMILEEGATKREVARGRLRGQIRSERVSEASWLVG